MIPLGLYTVNLQVAMPAILLCVIKLEFSCAFSNTGRFANVQLANVLRRFANVFSRFANVVKSFR